MIYLDFLKNDFTNKIVGDLSQNLFDLIYFNFNMKNFDANNLYSQLNYSAISIPKNKYTMNSKNIIKSHYQITYQVFFIYNPYQVYCNLQKVTKDGNQSTLDENTLIKMENYITYMFIGMYHNLNEIINHFGHLEITFQLNPSNNNLKLLQIKSLKIQQQQIISQSLEEFLNIVINQIDNKGYQVSQNQNLKHLKILINQENSNQTSSIDHIFNKQDISPVEYLQTYFNNKKLQQCLFQEYSQQHYSNSQAYRWLLKNNKQNWVIQGSYRRFFYNFHKCNQIIANRGVKNITKFKFVEQHLSSNRTTVDFHSIGFYILGFKREFNNFLQDYDNLQKYKNYDSTKFFPFSYNLDFKSQEIQQEEKPFYNLNPDTDNKPWIFKPSETSQGFGIQIFENLKEAQQVMKSYKNDPNLQKENEQAVIQKYIANIGLWKGKKFDLRCYLYVSNFHEGYQQAFYDPGYFRVTRQDYSQENPDYKNLQKHLTNISYNSKFDKKKGQSKYSGIVKTWQDFLQILQNDMKFSQSKIDSIIISIKKSVTYIAEAYFDLYKNPQNLHQSQIFGVDVIFDSDFNTYLLETNAIPLLIYDDNLKVSTTPILKSIYTISNNITEKLHENPDQKPFYEINQNEKLNTFELLIDNRIGYNYLQEQLQKEENTQKQPHNNDAQERKQDL